MAALSVDTYATGVTTLEAKGRVVVWNESSEDVWWTRTSGANPKTVGIPLAPSTGFEFNLDSGALYLAADTTDGLDVRYEGSD